MAKTTTIKPELTLHTLRSYLSRYSPGEVDEAAVLEEANETYARYDNWSQVPFTLNASWLQSIVDAHRQPTAA